MKKTNPTILIVDDDPNDLLFITAAFKTIGVTASLQSAISGDEAIDYLMGAHKYADRRLYRYPDFVITDLKMPGTDGFGLLRHLKLNPNSAAIPTVVLSGSQDDEDIQKAYLLGASSYHMKPSGLVELRVLVKTIYDYWLTCEIPVVNAKGHRTNTSSPFKMGPKLPEYNAPQSAPPIEEMQTGVGYSFSPI